MDGRNSPPKGVAVLVHGQGKTGASMDAMADSYGSFGWDSLVLDMRAHGESGGNWRTMGFLESKDLSFWLTWVTDKVPNIPLIVHGEGTGASAILRFAVNAPDSPGKQRVKGMVLDNPALNEGYRFRENIKRILAWPIFYAGPLLLVEILSLACCGITLKRMNLAPASRQGSPFSRIRIPLVLFENQDNEEKKERIANLIRRLS